MEEMHDVDDEGDAIMVAKRLSMLASEHTLDAAAVETLSNNAARDPFCGDVGALEDMLAMFGAFGPLKTHTGYGHPLLLQRVFQYIDRVNRSANIEDRDHYRVDHVHKFVTVRKCLALTLAFGWQRFQEAENIIAETATAAIVEAMSEERKG